MSLCFASPHPILSACRGSILIPGLYLAENSNVRQLCADGSCLCRRLESVYWCHRCASSGTATSGCWRLTRRGAASGAAKFGDVAGAAERVLVWISRWRGEWCGLPNPNCRHSAFSACCVHQISANTEQKRSLN